MHALRNEVSHTSASATNKARDIREYTLGEEIANSVTHGLGALLAIAAIPILVVRALDDADGVDLDETDALDQFTDRRRAATARTPSVRRPCPHCAARYTRLPPAVAAG